MKKTFSLLAIVMVFLSIANTAISQDTLKKGPFIYAEMGGGGGNFQSWHCSLNGIFAHHQTITAGFYYGTRKATNLPADFKPADNDGWFGVQKDPVPRQMLSMFGLMYGKAFKAGEGDARFILRGGLSFGTYWSQSDFAPTKVITFIAPYNGPYLSHTSNYIWKEKRKLVSGLILNPSLELPGSRIFGFSAGLYGNINAGASSVGIEANIIFGKLRNKRVRKLFATGPGD